MEDFESNGGMSPESELQNRPDGVNPAEENETEPACDTPPEAPSPASDGSDGQSSSDGWKPYERKKNYAYTWRADRSERRQRRSEATVLVVVLLTVVVLCALLLAWSITVPDDTSAISEAENSEIAASAPEESDEAPTFTDLPDLNIDIKDYDTVSTLYTELYEKCSGSCVSVICTYNGRYGYTLGSGFVLSEDGYIATNHHVIENADTIVVRFYDGTEYTAALVGSDSVTDLAVLFIDAGGLEPVQIGNSDAVTVGEAVVAIGTPYDLTPAGTMTCGIVSGLARDVECTDDYGAVVKTMTLIQTDASINPGNSGGPLFNIYGQVIGINTLKLMDEYEGIGFCIPITEAVEVFRQLVEYGEVNDYGSAGFVKATPKLHITVMSVSDARLSADYGSSIGPDAPDGVYVVTVTPGTAIYEAGLETYDIITEFNGITLLSKEDLANALSDCSVGQTVSAVIWHRGEYKTLTFKLDSAS